MLLCKHGGGNEHHDLFSSHHCFERGSDGHFCFPKPNIAADESIHGALRLHVFFGFCNGGELIRGFGVGEGSLEFGSPVGVGRERVSLVGVPFCMKREQASGITEHGLFSVFARTIPLAVAENT